MAERFTPGAAFEERARVLAQLLPAGQERVATRDVVPGPASMRNPGVFGETLDPLMAQKLRLIMLRQSAR